MINYTNLNQNINIYFKEIKSFKSLTREEEIVLFARIAQGDHLAETEVFNKMAKLAVAVAKTYTCRPELLEDLIQEANMGVLTAIKKYDPAMGYRFSSYARWWMKACISKYLNEMNIVHPTCNSKLICLAKTIAERFYQEHHREILDVELLEELESRGEVVADVTTLISVRTVRIDTPIDEQSEHAKMELEVFNGKTSSDNDFMGESENEALNSMISARLALLTEREQEIILLKFGFTTGYELESNKALMEEWNKRHPELKPLTEERIRQLVVSALKKMRG